MELTIEEVQKMQCIQTHLSNMIELMNDNTIATIVKEKILTEIRHCTKWLSERGKDGEL